MTTDLSHKAPDRAPVTEATAVTWTAWGDGLFDEAARRGRPIFLWIGLPGCALTAAMLVESLVCAETAALLNREFINVRVDGCRRPDLRLLYRPAIAQFGGADDAGPLVVFLTEVGEPFWGGGYLPRTRRQGYPSLRSVIERAAAMYAGSLAQTRVMARHARGHLEAMLSMPAPAASDETQWFASVAQPCEQWLSLALGNDHWTPSQLPYDALTVVLAGGSGAGALALSTLDRLVEGDRYDWVEGAWYPDLEDEKARFPGGGRSLIANCQLARLWLESYEVSGRESCRLIAEHTLAYVCRCFALTNGLLKARDARDVQSGAGWSEADLSELCDVELAQGLRGLLGFGHGRPAQLKKPVAQLAGGDLQLIKALRGHLVSAASSSGNTCTQEVAFTADNAFVVSTLCRAAAVLDEPSYLERARAVCKAIARELSHEASVYHGIEGTDLLSEQFVDNAMVYARALIDLFEATTEQSYLDEAVAVVESCVDRFWDQDDGALAYVVAPPAPLGFRPKQLASASYPCAHGVAVEVFGRLERLCQRRGQRRDFGQLAVRILRGLVPLLARDPVSLASVALGTRWHVGQESPKYGVD